VTRLRKMMLEEHERRTYSEITTRKHPKVVSDFAKHFGKVSRQARAERTTKPGIEVRNYAAPAQPRLWPTLRGSLN
jgi:hypothetical protein